METIGRCSSARHSDARASRFRRLRHPGASLGWIGCALACAVLEAGCSSKPAPISTNPDLTNPGGTAASRSASQPIQVVNPSDQMGQDSGPGGVSVTENRGVGADKGKGGLPIRWTDVSFDFDKADIRGDQQDILEANARELRRVPNIRILIEGHCDRRGTSNYNMALGKSRAEAVMDRLALLGISRDRMTTISYGKEKPLVLGNDEASFARNRVGHVDKKTLDDPRF